MAPRTLEPWIPHRLTPEHAAARAQGVSSAAELRTMLAEWEQEWADLRWPEGGVMNTAPLHEAVLRHLPLTDPFMAIEVAYSLVRTPEAAAALTANPTAATTAALDVLRDWAVPGDADWDGWIDIDTVEEPEDRQTVDARRSVAAWLRTAGHLDDATVERLRTMVTPPPATDPATRPPGAAAADRRAHERRLHVALLLLDMAATDAELAATVPALGPAVSLFGPRLVSHPAFGDLTRQALLDQPPGQKRLMSGVLDLLARDPALLADPALAARVLRHLRATPPGETAGDTLLRARSRGRVAENPLAAHPSEALATGRDATLMRLLVALPVEMTRRDWAELVERDARLALAAWERLAPEAQSELRPLFAPWLAGAERDDRVEAIRRLGRSGR